MPPVIILDHVSKRYRLGHDYGFSSARDAMAAAASRLVRRNRRTERPHVWSLRDVDLTVDAGQSLGLIGANGAGKSTLLKVITRITSPTTGISRTRGRIGSLLEVGTGFHPELSGRENVYLSGAILGMSRKETARKFDDIVEFAGVPEFIDTPVKRYSSGMYLRLAFSVAAHLDADISVIDEVLAVGDAAFQARCVDRIRQLSSSGRTVLFVSHDLAAVERVCSTAVWLERGRIIRQGPAAEVVAAYRAAGLASVAEATFDALADAVVLHSARVLDPSGVASGVMRLGERPTVEVAFTIPQQLPAIDGSIIVTNSSGVRVVDETWSDSGADCRGESGYVTARLALPDMLNAGEYRVDIWFGSPWETFVFREGALRFRIEGDGRGRTERLLRLGTGWDVQISPVEDPARGRQRPGLRRGAT